MAQTTIPFAAPARDADIDFLRGIAILLTLLAHIGFAFPFPVPLVGQVSARFAQFWIGVDLFFVISGFVIAGTLIPRFDAAADSAGRRLVVRAFYIRRFWRIVPLALFWAGVVLAICLMLAVFGIGKHRFAPADVAFRHFLAVAVFIENIYLLREPSHILSQYWSLAIEEQFYLAFPFLLLLRGRARIAVLVALIGLQGLLHRPPRQDVAASLIRYDALMMGVLLQQVAGRLREALGPALAGTGRGFRLALAGSMVALACALPPQAGGLRGYLTVVDLLCMALVALPVMEPRFFANALPGPVFRAVHGIGLRSFSIYLVHMPAFLLVATLLMAWRSTGEASGPLSYVVPLVAGLALTALLSEWSWRRIEFPTRERGRALADG